MAKEPKCIVSEAGAAVDYQSSDRVRLWTAEGEYLDLSKTEVQALLDGFEKKHYQDPHDPRYAKPKGQAVIGLVIVFSAVLMLGHLAATLIKGPDRPLVHATVAHFDHENGYQIVYFDGPGDNVYRAYTNDLPPLGSVVCLRTTPNLSEMVPCPK